MTIVVDLAREAAHAPRYSPLRFIAAWRQRHRDRRLLAMMNERELHDISLDRSMVETDDGPVFWRWRP